MVAATRGGRLPTGVKPTRMGGLSSGHAAGSEPDRDDAHLDTDLIRRAVSGERTAARRVVTRLAPTVQRSVISVLMANGRRACSRQEVEDLVQDNFAALFAHGGRELLRWDPDRGMQLASFVGLLAKRFTISRLRVRRVNTLPLTPSEPSAEAPTPGADAAFAAREDLYALGEHLRAALSPFGLAMFERLFVWDQSVEEICREANMSADAVYQWRKRLRDTIEEIRRQSAAQAASVS